MRRLWIGLGLSVSFAGALLACGAGRLPAPSYVGQPTEALQTVDYPPPPARVEYVPAVPKEGAVWIDGEWTWQGHRWAWKRGRWVVPPANAAYSPWTSTRDTVGTFYVAEGKWRDKELRELPDPPPLAVGRTLGGAVTSPEGETMTSTPNVPMTRTTDTGRGKTADDGGRPETPSGATPTGTETKPPAQLLDAGEPPSDAGLVDVELHDAMKAPDAEPLSALAGDPRESLRLG